MAAAAIAIPVQKDAIAMPSLRQRAELTACGAAAGQRTPNRLLAKKLNSFDEGEEPAMIVAIDVAHAVRLEQPLDFKRFHVEIAAPRTELAALRKSFATYGTIDDETHAWINAEALRQWPDLAGNGAYATGLGQMLDYAARKGWMSADGKRVRAHIVWLEGKS